MTTSYLTIIYADPEPITAATNAATVDVDVPAAVASTPVDPGASATRVDRDIDITITNYGPYSIPSLFIQDWWRRPSTITAITEYIQKSYGKNTIESAAIAEAISNAVDKPVSELTGLIEAIAMAYDKPVAEATALSESISKGIGIPANESTALLEIITKGIGLNPTESTGIVSTFAVSYEKLIVESLAIVEAMSKAVDKPFNEATGLVESFGEVMGLVIDANTNDLTAIAAKVVLVNQDYGADYFSEDYVGVKIVIYEPVMQLYVDTTYFTSEDYVATLTF